MQDGKGSADRVAAEALEHLRKVRAHLADAERIAHVGSWEWSVKTGEFYWSDQTYRIFGLSPEDFQPTYETVFSKMHPADQPGVQQGVEKALSVSDSYSVQFRIIRPSGEIRLIVSEGQRELDDDGNAERLYGAVWDITERSLLEANQIAQSQKMQTMGQLAGGIAHDFNNMLQVILGNAEGAMNDLAVDSSAFRKLERVVTTSRRAAELVDQILYFGSESDRRPKNLLLSEVVQEAMKLVRPSLPSTIVVDFSAPDSELHIHADPSEVYQVLLNLATNAYHALRPTGGNIGVQIASVTVGKEGGDALPRLPAGDYVRLRVNDDGPGISPQIIERIFDAHFTTKPDDEGRGLGLAVVRRILRDSGGEIAVRSEVGDGACFDAYFPKSAERSEHSVHQQEPVAIAGIERVLLVDDEPAVAEQFREGLARLGYQIDVFTDSEKALAQFLEAPNSYDVVLSDQTMPVLTGAQLARAIFRIRAATPFVLCTGFSEDLGEDEARTLGISEYVKKPASIADLALALRRAITARSKNRQAR
jgi:signal transduction histidine kinase/ActR/RegA family two-component response regulator